MLNPAIAYSQKSKEEDAIKEISLKIKYFLPRYIDLALMFFTPEYKPSLIQNVINMTLRPLYTIGIQAPLLIYEDKILDKGVVCACMEIEKAKIESRCLKVDKPEKIEVSLRESIRKLKPYKFLMGFLSPSANPYNYLKGAQLGVGKTTKVLGFGYEGEQKVKYSQILNNEIGDRLLYFGLGGDFNIHYQKISGFYPLGRPFKFTKIDKERHLILEIDNKPAIEIYKKYLEENFNLFKKNKLFYLYPLGVKSNGNYRLLNIYDTLEDESLFYLGNVNPQEEGKIMILNEELLVEDTKRILTNIKTTNPCELIIIANSLIRKNILKNKSNQEIALIKEIMDDTKIVGFYSDYQINFNSQIKEFIIEKGDLYLTLWKRE
jgi:hypothetical protein